MTATRRPSQLMDTPVAITAFDAAALKALGIDNGQDLAVRSPSLSVTGTPGKVSIRGVGRQNNALGSDPGVALYADGVYTTEASIFEANNLFDVQRIEVLRGPQGTLYGRNAVGGAINMISMPPTVIWQAKVVAEVGNYDYQVLQGLMSGPITDQLSMVVSGSTIKRDGYQEEVTSGEAFDDRDTQTLRASFKYHWNNIWYSRFQLNWADSDHRPSRGYRDLAPRATAESRSAYLLNEVALGDYRLKYLASYSEYEFTRLLDWEGMNSNLSKFDWSNLYLLENPVSEFTGIEQAAPFVSDIIAQQADFSSHDIQFYSELGGPLNFVSGLYYYRSNEDQFYALREENDELTAVYALPGKLVGRNTSSENWLYRGESDLQTTSMAAYGQATWDWTQQLRLTAGLRYSRDEKDGADNTFVQWTGDGDIARRTEDDWDNIDWRLGLDYRLGLNHLFYGVLSTGYRSGGFNYMKPTDSTDVDQVDPEDLLSFELGYKGSLFGNRLHLASAAYYYDYRDLQVIRLDVVNGVGLRSVDNAEEASAWGIEVEAAALVGEHLTLGGNWSFNHTRYGEYASDDANGCFATLHWPVGNIAMNWTVNYMYVGEQWMSPFNVDELDRVDAWDRWDSRLSATWGVWSLTAWVKNIADERNWVFRKPPGTVSHNYGAGSQLTEPRTYGLRLVYQL